jgi:transcriptional regulator with XRE-family HTH domain
MVGERIRARRNALGLTLRELAARIGMTAGYLSRVENNQVRPSLDALQAIAAELAVPMFTFLDTASVEPVVRANARRQMGFPDLHLSYELLTPDLGSQMMAVMIRLEAGGCRVAFPLKQPHEEWMYVVRGDLTVRLDSGEHRLGPGDTIYYNGGSLLEFLAGPDTDAEVICAIVPPVL